MTPQTPAAAACFSLFVQRRQISDNKTINYNYKAIKIQPKHIELDEQFHNRSVRKWHRIRKENQIRNVMLQPMSTKPFETHIASQPHHPSTTTTTITTHAPTHPVTPHQPLILETNKSTETRLERYPSLRLNFRVQENYLFLSHVYENDQSEACHRHSIQHPRRVYSSYLVFLFLLLRLFALVVS